MNAEHRVLKYFVVPFLLVCFFALSVLLVYMSLSGGYLNFGYEFSPNYWGRNENLTFKECSPTTPSDFELIADSAYRLPDWYVRDDLRGHETPGICVMMVKEGKPFFQKGYGFADLGTKTRFDPQTTVCLNNALSPVVLAIAISKLVEEGKVELDRDINDYLVGFKLGEVFGGPATIKSLLVGSSGLSSHVLGNYVEDPSMQLSIADFLNKNPPRRISEPMLYPGYSNYDSLLCAKIIEDVSTIPFDEYVQEKIFAPLMMKNSFFGVPTDAAKSFKWISKEQGFGPETLYLPIANPTGMLWTTAADAANVMIMLQNAGMFEGKQFLSKESVEKIVSPLFMVDKQMPMTRTLCFGNETKDGITKLNSGGYSQRYQSDFTMFPKLGVGYIILANGFFNTWDFESKFSQYFLADKVLPKAPKPIPTTIQKADISKYTGDYVSAYYKDVEGVSKLGAWIDSNSIRLNEKDGKLALWDEKLEQIDENLFTNNENTGYIKFFKGEDGNVLRMVLDGQYYSGTYTKMALFEDGTFMIVSMSILLVLLVIVVLLFFYGSLIRKASKERSTKLEWFARLTPFLAAVLYLFFAVGLVLAIAIANRNSSYAMLGLPWYAKVGLFVPILCVILSALTVFLAVRVWMLKLWTLSSRLTYSLITLVLLAPIPFLVFWNLFGYWGK